MFDRAFQRLFAWLLALGKQSLLPAVWLVAGVCLPVGSAVALDNEWPPACALVAWHAACESPTVRAPLNQIDALLDLYPKLGGSEANQQARQEQTQWLGSPPTQCTTPACWSSHALRRLSALAGTLALLRDPITPDEPELTSNASNGTSASKKIAPLANDEASRSTRAKLDGTQIYALAQRASVFMMGRAQGQPNKKIFGSGVILAPGLVATNYHVVRKAGSMAVLYQDRVYRFSVVAGDIGLDLVLLRVPGLPGTVLPLAPLKSVQPGQRVYAFGSPFGFTQSISDGIVSAVRPHVVNKTASLIQITTPISPGSSGGGLFDEQGALVGFTTASYKNAQNLNFAIPAELVKTLPPMTLFR